MGERVRDPRPGFPSTQMVLGQVTSDRLERFKECQVSSIDGSTGPLSAHLKGKRTLVLFVRNFA